jgi:predicted extracellular nuclease
LEKEATTLPNHPLHAPLRMLRIATINVENLFAGDPRVTDHARAIVERLDSPAIIALEEIQDASGPTNDGTVDGTATGAALVAAITALGGPAYQYLEVTPTNGTDGGQPGGNIRQAFLYRAPVTLKAGVVGDALTPTQVLADGTLSLNPGRIDPTNPAFTNSRKPLAATFRVHGRDLIVIANHWNSKGGDQPLVGRYQPPTLVSEIQRLAQAQVVARFVDRILDADPQALVAVVGDLNDFSWSSPVQQLTSVGMKQLDELLPTAARYSYVFQGNSQTLDHMLTSPALAALLPSFDIVHSNSEFTDQISDHDPSVARLTIIPRLPRWLANLLWPRPLDANG